MNRTSKVWRMTALMMALVLLAAVIPGASARPLWNEEGALAQQGQGEKKAAPEPSGIYDLREAAVEGGLTADAQAGLLAVTSADAASGSVFITECPQAGLEHVRPQPLRNIEEDAVEQLSSHGDDGRLNSDFSCFPQDETTVDVNPRNSRNIVAGANDYRLATGSSGFYASTDGGKNWYSGIIPFPSAPGAQSRGEGFIISGGDPVVAFDRDGNVYYSMIAFFRGDDTNGVFVSRSTNGGFTWTRGCVPSGTTDANAFCVAAGLDPRTPGDGRVIHTPDNDLALNGSVPFNDKEWMTAGPRPAGVNPVCFTPITRTATACNPNVVGVDRVYVTWTIFGLQGNRIHISYSDDQGRSWSPSQAISGSAPFCEGGVTSPTGCDFNQASVPTVNPYTGHLYVAWINSNTPDENQYLMVRSTDGGNTFQGPFHITPIYDVNFPRAGGIRPDCSARGQQGNRIVYTNSCFRSNPYGNIVVDKRGGAFADDLYVVISDNRNGTGASSNADAFLFKSTDGGTTWIGPTRVNDDASSLGSVSRDCGRTPGFLPASNVAALCGVGTFGADQWWPWVDINTRGDLVVTFHDRRNDTDSTLHEWPGSRSRPGNYLVWRWGAQCRVRHPNSTECLSPGAIVMTQPSAPVDPGPDPVPGQGNSFLGSFRNFQISDVPSNFDYSFRAGIFAGDYENVAVEGSKAYAVWTDARNGRSSRTQSGRNPICEQSDVFIGVFDIEDDEGHANNRSLFGGHGTSVNDLTPFLVTPCPASR